MRRWFLLHLLLLGRAEFYQTFFLDIYSEFINENRYSLEEVKSLNLLKRPLHEFLDFHQPQL